MVTIDETPGRIGDAAGAARQMDSGDIVTSCYFVAMLVSGVVIACNSAGLRLLLIFVLLEGVIGARLSFFSFLHLSLPQFRIRIPVLPGFGLSLVQFVRRLTDPLEHRVFSGPCQRTLLLATWPRIAAQDKGQEATFSRTCFVRRIREACAPERLRGEDWPRLGCQRTPMLSRSRERQPSGDRARRSVCWAPGSEACAL